MVDAGARRRTPNHCALALAAGSLIAALLARGQPPAAAGKPQVFTSRSNLVLLPTRVQDKRGEAIYGLRAEQFIVEDNGARQSVQVDEEPDEERDAAGLSLVVAVQCGRSAPAEFAKLKGLAAMVDAIVGEAPHEVALIGYGQTPYLLGDFSSKPDAFRFALSRLKPCGDYHAAAIDAVEYAIGMLKRSLEHNRRAILLIGETRDHGSSTKLNDVVSELGINDTVIYSVAFSPARDEFIDPFRGREEPRPPDPNPHPKKRIQEEPPPDAAPEPVFGYRSQLGAAASVDADYQCAQE